MRHTLEKIIRSSETRGECINPTIDHEIRKVPSDNTIPGKVYGWICPRTTQSQCPLHRNCDSQKTVLPSLKPSTEKMLKSGIVYKLTCPSCNACYVGETTRHMQSRFREHLQRVGPIKHHMKLCRSTLLEDVNILKASARGETYLLTLEALYQGVDADIEYEGWVEVTRAYD